MTTLPTDVMLGGEFISRAEFDEYNDWREQQGRPRITSFKTRAELEPKAAPAETTISPGFVRVPIEPTPEMLAAFQKQMHG